MAKKKTDKELLKDAEKVELKRKANEYKNLISQIESEYKISWYFMKPKIDEWALRLKLYNNQKRDKEAIGDPLIFTIHQTILASLYNDKLGIKFSGREPGDEETGLNLDKLAEYDCELMDKDIFDYEFDWDASFFGRGLAVFSEWDRELKVPLPQVIDMMTFLRDPFATSSMGNIKGVGALKWGGREIRLSKNEMRKSGIYFDFENLKATSRNIQSLFEDNVRARNTAQGLQDVSTLYLPKGDNETFVITEWFTMWQGQLCIVGLAENRSRIIRFTPLEGKTKFPLIDRAIYPIAHDWDGVSIPDLIEDKQRARSVIQNIALKGAKANLNPMYVFNTNKIKNKNDLNFDFNKFVPVDGDTNGAIMPIERNMVKQEVNWILDTLDTAAQRATATPEIQQGANAEDRRTATEMNLVNQKVDTRYSLSAKIFGWSEKRFWRQWYELYKEHFTPGIEEKVIRIAGSTGNSWRKLTRDNIVMKADPDIKVESKTVSEMTRMNKLENFRKYVRDAVSLDPSANLRFALKELGKLSGFDNDIIDSVLPPNYDEMKAEDENTNLSLNWKTPVNENDDDIVHLQIHAKAAETPFKLAHVNAHKRAMMVKKSRPDMFAPTNPNANGMNEEVPPLNGGVGMPAKNPMGMKGGMPNSTMGQSKPLQMKTPSQNMAEGIPTNMPYGAPPKV